MSVILKCYASTSTALFRYANIVRTFTSTPVRFVAKGIGPTHRVNNLEKRFLVWTGKYKRVEDVPLLVTPDVVERARNRMRIRIANLMMVATLIGCFFMAMSGKRARERGESVEKQNLDWHKQIHEDYLKKQT